MEILRYIFATTWSQFGTVGRAFWVAGFVVPFALSTQAGRLKMPVLGNIANAFPWWGWVFVGLIVSLCVLVYGIGKHAKSLDEDIKALREKRNALNVIGLKFRTGLIDPADFRDSPMVTDAITVEIRNDSRAQKTVKGIGITARTKHGRWRVLIYKSNQHETSLRPGETTEFLLGYMTRRRAEPRDSHLPKHDILGIERKRMYSVDPGEGFYIKHAEESGSIHQLRLLPIGVTNGAEEVFHLHADNHSAIKFGVIAEKTDIDKYDFRLTMLS